MKSLNGQFHGGLAAVDPDVLSWLEYKGYGDSSFTPLLLSLSASSSSRLLSSLPLTTTAPLSLYLCIRRSWKEFRLAARHLPGCAGWLRDSGDSRHARACPGQS